MQRQTHAAQHRPKVVTVAVVRLLVGERVAQRLRLRARVGCDVNARLRHAEQARRIRLTALVDRQAGVGLLHALTRAAQFLAEAQVHGEEHQSQRRRAGEPDGFAVVTFCTRSGGAASFMLCAGMPTVPAFAGASFRSPTMSCR